jgi:hypothetical protein
VADGRKRSERPALVSLSALPPTDEYPPPTDEVSSRTRLSVTFRRNFDRSASSLRADKTFSAPIGRHSLWQSLSPRCRTPLGSKHIMTTSRPDSSLPSALRSVAGTTQRRDFVRGVFGLAGSAMLAACGGGGAAEPAETSGRLSPPASPSSPPPPVDATNTLRVSLPAGSETNYPLQFGRAFAKGEIRRTPLVLLDAAVATQAQVDVKTRHEDGSVRFAVVSVVLPVLSTTERVLSFADAEATAASAEPVERMLADYDFEATIRLADRTGAVLAGSPTSARAILTPLNDAALAAETVAGGSGPRYWTQGPVCTTVLLHDHRTKAHDVGTNATKAIRPMFIVQFWPGIKRYHVRHVLEIADVTKLKEETGLEVQFSTGRSAPRTNLSQTAVNLYIGSFASRAYWNGTEVPRANVDHSLAYLSKTQVVPNFDRSVTINATSLASYQARLSGMSRVLGAAGDWTKVMAATGGRSDLGLFPKWDVLALYTGAAHMHEYAESHAEFAGWWNMHFREGSAAKTLAGSDGMGRILSKMAGGRPTHSWFAVTPSPQDAFTVDGPQSNREGWGADDAHTPGLYFLQYITTGSYFWYEKLIQLGAYSLFFVNPGAAFNSIGNGRNSTDMILNGVQLRSYGWQMRNRARAWWAASDPSPERALFSRALEDALAQRAGLFDVPGLLVSNPVRVAWNESHTTWWASVRGGMISRPRPNAMGWAECGIYDAGSDGAALPSDARSSTALWQHNYCVVSLAHAAELGLTDARAIADWMGRSVLQIANSSEPRHLGDYIIPNTKLDGSFYQSPAEIWASYAHNADSLVPSAMPQVAENGFPGSGQPNTFGVTVEGYGSIAAAAIAMIANTSGGSTAWNTVRPWHASTRYYDHDPRWAIIPRS